MKVTMQQIELIGNSFELFNLINEHRVMAGKKPMKYHRDLMVKIKDEVIDFELREKTHLVRINNLGLEVKDLCYILNRKDVYTLAMRESKEVRSSIYDYIESLEKELQGLKDNIYYVITNKGFLGQELGLKCAGITHPRIFMEMTNNREAWNKHIVDNKYFGLRRVGKNPSDMVLAWSREGFEWLVRNTNTLNDRVEEYKVFKKSSKSPKNVYKAVEMEL